METNAPDFAAISVDLDEKKFVLPIEVSMFAPD